MNNLNPLSVSLNLPLRANMKSTQTVLSVDPF